jgi:hypothetical protein
MEDRSIGLIKRSDKLKGEVYRTPYSEYYALVNYSGKEYKSPYYEDEDICYSWIHNKFSEITGERL